MHWAENGNQVFYITASPLKSFPAQYHDREDVPPAVYNMIKFMYAFILYYKIYLSLNFLFF